jgi:DNA-binding response OmpR family regulator
MQPNSTGNSSTLTTPAGGSLAPGEMGTPGPGRRASSRLRVLIVEDTATVAAVIQKGLLLTGIITEVARSGAEAIEQKAAFRPDIVLLDLGLPDRSGLGLMRQMVAQGDCGVIVITATGDEATRITGLDTGADDYLVKPILIRELAARIRALHRRLHGRAERGPIVLTLDRTQRIILGRGDSGSPLTGAEVAALETLINAQGTSVSRECLTMAALRRPLRGMDRSIDQLILKLRRKLIQQGSSSRAILSVRGEGYVMTEPALFRYAPDLKASRN